MFSRKNPKTPPSPPPIFGLIQRILKHPPREETVSKEFYGTVEELGVKSIFFKFTIN